MKVRFIDSQYMFDNSIIDSNVDAQLVTKAIDMAQRMNIQEALGHTLYEKYQSIISDNSIRTDPNNLPYLNLMTDKIMEAHMWWVTYYIYDLNNYHITNKSVATKSSDYGQPVSDNTLDRLMKTARSTAEFCVERIRETILNSPGDYPEYYTYFGVNRIKPKSDNYFGGVYLPKKGYWC